MKKAAGAVAPEKLKNKQYEKELRKLQAKLCHLQDWVKHKGLRIVIVFEGRDAAGKGATIKSSDGASARASFGSLRCLRHPLVKRTSYSSRGTSNIFQLKAKS